MITFEQARETVRTHLDDPTLDVAPHGFGDKADWLVLVRAVFPAPDVDGGPIFLVDRATGLLHTESFLVDVDRYQAMLSTGGSTFVARAAEGAIVWYEHAPHLVGDADLVAQVEVALFESAPTVAVTPTGPFAPAIPSSGEAVFGVLLSLGHFEFWGDVPTFSVPFGAHA